jgi:drug/metabolite transporter (DMT)-like permease
VSNPPGRHMVKTLVFTVLALLAFAANSVLCRMALGARNIDAAGFTVIRLLAGAIVLWAILSVSRGSRLAGSRGSWSAAAMLFLYAAAFSYAYMTLDTGTGALILFGSVQLTMVLLSLLGGTRLHPTEWAGITIAFSGLVYLLLPGATAPSPVGFVLMAVAGTAWGIYTLKGRGSGNPLADTTWNFVRTLPLVLVLAIVALQAMHYSSRGILLAILSGAIASGVGYTIWYNALRGLSATQAAVVQLSVPVIAALGGVLFMSETITLRLLLASALTLGGILLVVSGRYHQARSS